MRFFNIDDDPGYMSINAASYPDERDNAYRPYTDTNQTDDDEHGEADVA